MTMPVRSSHKLLLCPYTLFFSVVLCTYSMAQITIPQSGFSNLLAVGKSFNFYRSDSIPQPVNIGKRGGSNVYDFTGYKFALLGVANNYSVGAIPTLAARYPAKAITFGSTAETIENNPLFLFGVDTLFVLGEASLVPPRRFRHNRPYEPMAIFPVTYQTTRTYSSTHYDTTFNASGGVAATNVYSGSDSVTVDGFGTLKVLGRQFECLRVKLNHYTFSDKEFMYMTREGLFLDIMMASSERDTGLVQPTNVMLLVPSSLVGVEEQAQLPSGFTLAQNYPNPFNPTTAISFQLSAFSFVKLEVFDLLGRKIATLVDEGRPAGTHTVRWDGSGSPSGIYFYQLMVGEFRATKKMILLE